MRCPLLWHLARLYDLIGGIGLLPGQKIDAFFTPVREEAVAGEAAVDRDDAPLWKAQCLCDNDLVHVSGA